ncbi:hypothetical protein NIES970_18100 [[Synechococcus] sp. NIES-970]|nr:hypothetical protein NIES970_18100 [[Synechococcus] sp. NIES-970]
MQIIASPITRPATSSFFPKQDQSASKRLVAHWLKDSSGKLYRIWVNETVKS